MKFWSQRSTTVLILVIGALLPVLAFVQYHWLGELSRLEQQHRADNLQVAARHFSGDFDSELARLYQAFHVREAEIDNAASEMAKDYTEWARTVPYAHMVEAVYWVEVHEEGAPRIQNLDLVNGELYEIDWPPELESLWDVFARPGYVDPLQDAVPALVVDQHGIEPEPWAVVVLDLDVIVEEFLAERVAHFSGHAIDFDALIVGSEDRDAVVYTTSSGLSPKEFIDHGEVARARFFGLHTRDFRFDWIEALPTGATEHRFRLYVRHAPGSLEAAVGAIRTRNLLISFGILVLLAGSILLLLLSTQRAERWARLQLEYVARIAHELRTPLAVIGFASENLADEVVHDLDKARTYGQVINKESRRLSKLVESALLHSRLESRSEMERRPVSIAEVIDAALGESDITGVDVRKDLADELPEVIGDVEALQSALQNLFSNALKYGGKPGRLSVSARPKPSSDGTAVEIEIEDHGPGIPSADLPHIFEPFYRGKVARDEQIEGSGIGLSLVKHVVDAHGGTIRVTSPEGGGSRFTVLLPAA